MVLYFNQLSCRAAGHLLLRLLCACVVIVPLLLVGCNKAGMFGFRQNSAVTVMNPERFSIFLSCTPEECADRNLTSPAIRDTPYPDEFQPASYGKELYSRLSLRFLWSAEERQRTQEHITHADLPSAEESLHIDTSTLRVLGEFGTDSYELVAILDWDQDGKRDWLVEYLYVPAFGEETSRRFLVIPSPASSGIFDATVVFAEECAYGTCTSYSGAALTERQKNDPAS